MSRVVDRVNDNWLLIIKVLFCWVLFVFCRRLKGLIVELLVVRFLPQFFPEIEFGY